MSKELLVPFITSALSVMGLYIHDQYKRYNASLKQARNVSRTMEEVLTGTVRLFNQKKPCLHMKPELSGGAVGISAITHAKRFFA